MIEGVARHEKCNEKALQPDLVKHRAPAEDSPDHHGAGLGHGAVVHEHGLDGLGGGLEGHGLGASHRCHDGGGGHGGGHCDCTKEKGMDKANGWQRNSAVKTLLSATTPQVHEPGGRREAARAGGCPTAGAEGGGEQPRHRVATTTTPPRRHPMHTLPTTNIQPPTLRQCRGGRRAAAQRCPTA